MLMDANGCVCVCFFLIIYLCDAQQLFEIRMIVDWCVNLQCYLETIGIFQEFILLFSHTFLHINKHFATHQSIIMSLINPTTLMNSAAQQQSSLMPTSGCNRSYLHRTNPRESCGKRDYLRF